MAQQKLNVSPRLVHYSAVRMCCSMQCAILLPHLGLATPLTVSAHTQARVNLQQSSTVCGLNFCKEVGFVFYIYKYIYFIFFLYLSRTQKRTLIPCLFISLSVPLLFVTSSLFLAHSLVIVQQSTSRCVLSKRKPLDFLLCSQFVLIDCSLTSLYVL